MSTPKQDSLFVHHFGVTHQLLAALLAESDVPADKRQGRPYTDIFYDTPYWKLAKDRSWWLRKRTWEDETNSEDEWCLKMVMPPAQSRTAEANALNLAQRLSSVDLIEQELAKEGLPPLPRIDDTELNMTPIAFIDACRIVILNTNSLRMWGDCVRAGSEYLLIGGCSSKQELGIAELRRRLSDRDGYIAPVLSAVLETLKRRQSMLYKQLLEGPSPRVFPMDNPDAHKVRDLPEVFDCPTLRIR